MGLCEKVGFFYNYDTYEGNEALKWTVLALFSLVCVAGLLGNLLVIAAMLRCPELRTLRNLFILNLASSDLLMCTVTAPFTFYLASYPLWIFGNVPCKILSSAQAVNIFVSTLGLAAIGLDRYLLIIFPVRFRSNYSVAIAVFLLVWSVSILLAVPPFLATSSMPPPHFPFNETGFMIAAANCGFAPAEVCIETGWSDAVMSGRTYTLLCFIFQYMLPLCVLSAGYCQICSKLRARSNVLKSNSRMGDEAQRRQRRTIILLTSLVGTFATCWLPFNLYNTLVNFNVIPSSTLGGMIWCNLIGMCSACINPVLYGFLNENFKAAYKQMFHSAKLRCRGAKSGNPPQKSSQPQRNRLEEDQMDNVENEIGPQTPLLESKIPTIHVNEVL